MQSAGAVSTGWLSLINDSAMSRHRGNGNSSHDRLTLADIEKRLRADGYSQDEIDTSLMFVMAVREQLSRVGKWPPPKREYVA
jgi:hypothetical protein